MAPALAHVAQLDTAVLQACAEGNAIALDHAVRHGGDPGRARDSSGFTAQHFAALGGDVAIGAYLQELGVSPTIADAQGVLPLHCACHNGHLDFVAWLVDADDAISSATLRRWALKRDDSLVWAALSVKARRLLSERRRLSEAEKAEARKEMRAARAPKLNALVDAQGGTALHHAALGGQQAVVRYLLHYGADERAATVDGLTAEVIARQAGEVKTAITLRCYSTFLSSVRPDRPALSTTTTMAAAALNNATTTHQPPAKTTTTKELLHLNLPPPLATTTTNGNPSPMFLDSQPPVAPQRVFPPPAMMPPSTSTTGVGLGPPQFAAHLPAPSTSLEAIDEDDDGLDEEERAALAEAEREAEQFRQEAHRKQMIEQESRRQSEEGEEAARRLVEEQLQQQRERIAQRRQQEENEDWLKRYQAECQRREEERLRWQAQQDERDKNAPQPAVAADGGPAAAPVALRPPEPEPEEKPSQEEPPEPEEEKRDAEERKDAESPPREEVHLRAREEPRKNDDRRDRQAPPRSHDDSRHNDDSRRDNEPASDSRRDDEPPRFKDSRRDNAPPRDDAPRRDDEPRRDSRRDERPPRDDYRRDERRGDENDYDSYRRRQHKRPRREYDHSSDDDDDDDRYDHYRSRRRSRRHHDSPPEGGYHHYRGEADRRSRRRPRGLSPASRAAMKQLAEAATAGAVSTENTKEKSAIWNGAMAIYESKQAPRPRH